MDIISKDKKHRIENGQKLRSRKDCLVEISADNTWLDANKMQLQYQLFYLLIAIFTLPPHH